MRIFKFWGLILTIALGLWTGCASNHLKPTLWDEATRRVAQETLAQDLFDWTILHANATSAQKAKATYQLARVLSRLGLNAEARIRVQEAMEQEKIDSLYHLLQLAQLELDYAERKLVVSAKGPYPLQGTTFEANYWYLAGQVCFLNNEDTLAQRFLNLVPAHHPDFKYAQFTLATSLARSLQMEQAKRSYENVIVGSPQNPGEKRLQDAAHVRLGHILLDEKNWRDAFPHYHAVIQASAFRDVDTLQYGQASLALYWISLVLNQVDRLREVLPTPIYSMEPLRTEFEYLEALYHMQKRDFKKASQLFHRVELATEKSWTVDTLPYHVELEINSNSLRNAYRDAQKLAFHKGSLDSSRSAWLNKWTFAFEKRLALRKSKDWMDLIPIYDQICHERNKDAQYLQATLRVLMQGDLVDPAENQMEPLF